MTCKYKDHPFPPCGFVPHPHDNNIYFCPHCRESYDVREIRNPFFRWLPLIIGILIVIFIINPQAFAPTQDNQQHSNHTRMH
jgi:hypothetical protein